MCFVIKLCKSKKSPEDQSETELPKEILCLCNDSFFSLLWFVGGTVPAASALALQLAVQQLTSGMDMRPKSAQLPMRYICAEEDSTLLFDPTWPIIFASRLIVSITRVFFVGR